MTPTIGQFAEFFENYRIGFISINGYENSKGEVSNRTINVGYSYEKLKEHDLNVLNEGVEYIPSERYTRQDWEQAIVELKNSITSPSVSRSRGQSDNYISLTENNAVRYNINTREAYISGLTLEGSKKIIVEGNYPTVNSRPKTIAKNIIKKNYLKCNKIGQYTIKKIKEVKMNGETLEIIL